MPKKQQKKSITGRSKIPGRSKISYRTKRSEWKTYINRHKKLKKMNADITKLQDQILDMRLRLKDMIGQRGELEKQVNKEDDIDDVMNREIISHACRVVDKWDRLKQ